MRTVSGPPPRGEGFPMRALPSPPPRGEGVLDARCLSTALPQRGNYPPGGLGARAARIMAAERMKRPAKTMNATL